MATTDVVVRTALDVVFELAAAVLEDTNTWVASANAASLSVPCNKRRVLVICGEHRLEDLKEVLLETCFVGVGVSVVVATPLQAVQIR